MRQQLLGTDVDVPLVALVVLLLATGGTLAVAASTSNLSFSTYNVGWDGATELQNRLQESGREVRVVHERDVEVYGTVPPSRTAAVVFAPQSNYDASTRERIGAFVRDGGTLIVAGDFGAETNDLLAAVGADARIDRRLLRDDRSNYRRPALPIVSVESGGELTGTADELTLNYGTAVEPGGATVLARTSPYAYLDTDRDADIDASEELRSYPVVTAERVGDGRVVVIGDPSVFVNAMLERGDNAAFARGLLDGYERVVLDYSRGGEPPLLVRIAVVLRESLRVQLAIAGGLLVGVWTWSRRRREPEVDPLGG